ncbi:hypothetical protein CVT25_009767 [Psilocybe cyanescens]|uniref:DUF6534 domain-containing protein n=1 Tax=Psilocybe cyanescens TaxID=93625 RepID=A0A409XQ84_PSICY|nr:hypothetical protein CVT25_009767 [Psilocybe cyanescens]
MATIDVPKTFGAILLGGLYASLLSGIVLVQVIIYFKLYPSDTTQIKSLVLVVWLLDTSHTAFIWSALWSYLIEHYAQPIHIDMIHWDIAVRLHIPFPTQLPNSSFPSRKFTAHHSDDGNPNIHGPHFLCPPHLHALHYGTFSRFRDEIKWIFTTGLALSTAVDIFITGSLFMLLHLSRTGAANLNAVIDSLIKYAFETGLLTCAGTVISMICWLTMPTNLIFMGLHFVIGKFYANSLLVTLNMRETIRRARSHRSKEGRGIGGESPGNVHHVLDTRRRRGSLSASGNDDHFAVRNVANTPNNAQALTKTNVTDVSSSSPSYPSYPS